MKTWPLLLCIHFTSCLLLMANGNTNSGKSYLFMVPGFVSDYDNSTGFPNVEFCMYTLGEQKVEVQISTEGMVDLEGSYSVFTFSFSVMQWWMPHTLIHGAKVGVRGLYRFEGNHVFGMNVFTSNNLQSAGMLSALAVERWKRKYIVFTLNYKPSVHVLTPETNSISFTIPADSGVVVENNGVVYEHGKTHTIELLGYSSFEISDCSSAGSLTGTIIEGISPFGVITGNCEAITKSFQCDTDIEVDGNSADSTAEMLLPVNYWGREFITLTIPSRKSHGYVVVMAGEDDTSVWAAKDNSGHMDFFKLTTQAQTVMIPDNNNPYLLTSDKGVQVFYVQRSVCSMSGEAESRELGDPSITVIIPTQLFYHSFYWQSPAVIMSTIHYVAIVIPRDHISQLVLDGLDLSFISGQWISVIGKPPWQVGHALVKEGHHHLTVRVSLYFGCYIYGLAPKMSYMSPSNFIAESINEPCSKSVSSMTVGDHLDNDCDQRVDEEFPDGEDNDNDGEIDEDLINVNMQCTAKGKHYLFMFPGVTEHDSDQWPHISFYFFTFTPGGVEVQLTTEHFQNLSEVFTVGENNVHVYSLSRSHMNKKSSGVKGTYRATGSNSFAMSVLIAEWKSSIDTFTLIPVDAWGTKYFAITLGTTPSVHVIAQEFTVIYFYFRDKQKDWFYLHYGNSVFELEKHIKISLSRFESFEVSECRSLPGTGRLTGSMLEGNYPYGVISGSCRASSPSGTCKLWPESVETDTRDLVAEMLLPAKSFGKEFISVSFPNVKDRSYLIVVASTDNTQVTLSGALHLLSYLGDWLVLNSTGKVTVLRASQPVQVIQVLRSICEVTGSFQIGLNGDPSIGLLIPTALFFYRYLWGTHVDIDADHYLVAVYDQRFFDTLLLDNDVPEIESMSPVEGKERWVVSHVLLHYENLHIMLSTKYIHFGLYVYGIAKELSYLNPVDFLLTSINVPCINSVDKMILLDKIDNDCDGLIDEEVQDNIDNDNDKKIDEDLNDTPPSKKFPTKKETTSYVKSTAYIPVAKTTTHERPFEVFTKPPTSSPVKPTPKRNQSEKWYWSEWKCSRQCQMNDLVRIRLCGSKTRTIEALECPGSVTEYKEGDCYIKAKCPRDCPLFQWDVDCTKSCDKCRTDCDKFNGTCSGCIAGYKQPSLSCSSECDFNEYGEDCQGTCLDRCGEDCVDKRTGECPRDVTIWTMVLISISVAFPCLLLFCLKNKLPKFKPASE